MEETSEELPNFSLGTDLLARKQPTSKSKTNGNDAVELMHGSILPVTMPPPPGICNFALTWRSIPHPPGTQKETIPYPWDSLSTTNTLFCVQNIDYDVDFRRIAKPDVLTRS